MAATSDHDIVLLGPADTDAAMPLSVRSGWNQNRDDWRFFLTAGRVFGIRDGSGRLIATAALLPYAGRQAWISMVLVAEDWQRRGFATRLMAYCIAAADNEGLTCWLDATPAGAAVYEKLGFVPVTKLQRIGLQSRATRSAAVAETIAVDPDDLIVQDRHAMGFDRSALLSELSARPNARILGWRGAVAFVRDGLKARHVGPVIADDVDRAYGLIAAIAAETSDPLLIDARDDDRGLSERLTKSGWLPQRPFLRMRLGADTVTTDGRAFAGAGPEYG